MQRNKRTGFINLGEKNNQVKPKKRYYGFEGIIIIIDKYTENLQVTLKILEGKYIPNGTYKVKTIKTLILPSKDFYVDKMRDILQNNVVTEKQFDFQIPEIAMFREDMAKLHSKNL